MCGITYPVYHVLHEKKSLFSPFPRRGWRKKAGIFVKKAHAGRERRQKAERRLLLCACRQAFVPASVCALPYRHTNLDGFVCKFTMIRKFWQEDQAKNVRKNALNVPNVSFLLDQTSFFRYNIGANNSFLRQNGEQCRFVRQLDRLGRYLRPVNTKGRRLSAPFVRIQTAKGGYSLLNSTSGE